MMEKETHHFVLSLFFPLWKDFMFLQISFLQISAIPPFLYFVINVIVLFPSPILASFQYAKLLRRQTQIQKALIFVKFYFRNILIARLYSTISPQQHVSNFCKYINWVIIENTNFTISLVHTLLITEITDIHCDQ